MKNKYTKYIVGLLIGLLSLPTFSSCVHTGRTLGAHNSYTLKHNNEEDKDNTKKSKGCASKTGLYCWSGFISTLLFTSGTIWLYTNTNNSAQQINSSGNNTIATAGYPFNETNRVHLLNNIMPNDSPNLKGYKSTDKTRYKFSNNNRLGSATSELQKLNEMPFYELVRKMSKKNFNLNKLKNVNKKQFTKDLLIRVIKNPYKMPSEQLEKTFIYVMERGKIDLDELNNGNLTPRDYIKDYNPSLIEVLDKHNANKHKNKALKMKNP